MRVSNFISMTHRKWLFPLAVVVASCVAVPAFSQESPPTAIPGYVPIVPVSAFARPASWFDPSRLHVSTSVSVGSGWNGGTSALQVTSLNYAFKGPLSMRVSLGNTLGTSGGGNNAGNFFLEGLALDYRPSASTLFHLEYRNVRSPLQYGLSDYSPWGRGWAP
jgi:hypothetical protein